MDAESAAFLLFDSLDNLPSEVANFMDELRGIDVRSTDASQKIRQRDSQLHKAIRRAERGSLEVNPKEEQYYPKIRADYQRILERSYEKEKLAEKVLELLDRTLRKVDDESKKINLLEGSGASGLSSGLGTPIAEKTQHAAFGGVGGFAASPIAQSPAAATPRPAHKRSRSSIAPAGGVGGGANSARPVVSSSLANPPLLPNGYPAPPANLSAEDNDDTSTYCFCDQVSYGEMVACDNDMCSKEWFHYGCVGLKEPPVGKWYCSDCAKVRVK